MLTFDIGHIALTIFPAPILFITFFHVLVPLNVN